ncbi:hypothetical protein E4U21_002058 [Claviceps maximensis]|nr:hypothetical protein E4U21_002058 [Claviceps maximensis]
MTFYPTSGTDDAAISNGSEAQPTARRILQATTCSYEAEAKMMRTGLRKKKAHCTLHEENGVLQPRAPVDMKAKLLRLPEPVPITDSGELGTGTAGHKQCASEVVTKGNMEVEQPQVVNSTRGINGQWGCRAGDQQSGQQSGQQR